jgi:anaerobic selenocysteine-containing dehydrogenase
MSETQLTNLWRQTACNLCYINCGIEVITEGRRMVKIRGDKAHPDTRGYACQKAQRLDYYQNLADRLTTPLRRRADGSFESISWETAIAEIAERLTQIRARHGGNAFALYGGGGQGNHSDGAFAVSLMRAMGSAYFANALAQEKTGDFWVNGHLFGAQNCHTSEDVEHCDLLVVLGCNPYQAHGFRRARAHLNEIKRNADRKMIAIDPRRTETAAVADLHLQLRPGTDAFLLTAILSLILQRGAEDRAFIEDHTVGFDEVRQVLLGVPIDEWIAHAEVSRAEVDRAVDMILAARSMVVRVELGIQQARHSTLNSYLEKLLYLITGNFGRRGTNNLHSWLFPLWQNSHGERIPISGQERIAGLCPPNRLPADILTSHPDRIRCLWVDSANPLNTVADTHEMERAARSLELMVTVDIAMTETAALSHYVLPAATQYEKWEFTAFTFEFPTNYFQLRAPLFEPMPGTLPECEIYSRLLRAMGDLPAEAELTELREVVGRDRKEFIREFGRIIQSRPGLGEIAPVVLYETLGRTLEDGAAVIAPLWSACHRLAAKSPEAVRAAGLKGDGFDLGEALFDKVRTSRSGMAFTKHQYDQVWELVAHPDRKIRLSIPSMLEWIKSLDSAKEVPDPDYPFFLHAGQRRSYNANQIFRNPAWRKEDPDGALKIHPDDIAQLGAADGGWMIVETPRGSVVVRIEADDSMRRGMVGLPHGYGQYYPGPDGRVLIGPRINFITASDDCDPITATPHHRNVAVRLRPADGPIAASAEARSAGVRALMS